VAVAPRSYRAWKLRHPSTGTIDDAILAARLRQLREHDGRGRQRPEVLYGRRKMTAWLARTGFPTISKHTVDRLMRDEGMAGLVRGRKTVTTIPAKSSTRAGDMLNRQFTAPRPNHTWVTDFTYVPTWSGFVYVAFVIDLFSRSIVGWQASTVKDTAFVEGCLRMALSRRDHTGRPIEPGMIHHSDACPIHLHPLHRDGGAGRAHRLDRERGRCVRECGRGDRDGTLQERSDRENVPLPQGALKGLPEVKEIVFDWVSWYDNDRLHRFLGNIPPEEYERDYYSRTSAHHKVTPPTNRRHETRDDSLWDFKVLQAGTLTSARPDGPTPEIDLCPHIPRSSIAVVTYAKPIGACAGLFHPLTYQVIPAPPRWALHKGHRLERPR
jgi:putative transposase